MRIKVKRLNHRWAEPELQDWPQLEEASLVIASLDQIWTDPDSPIFPEGYKLAHIVNRASAAVWFLWKPPVAVGSRAVVVSGRFPRKGAAEHEEEFFLDMLDYPYHTREIDKGKVRRTGRTANVGGMLFFEPWIEFSWLDGGQLNFYCKDTEAVKLD